MYCSVRSSIVLNTLVGDLDGPVKPALDRIVCPLAVSQPKRLRRPVVCPSRLHKWKKPASNPYWAWPCERCAPAATRSRETALAASTAAPPTALADPAPAAPCPPAKRPDRSELRHLPRGLRLLQRSLVRGPAAALPDYPAAQSQNRRLLRPRALRLPRPRRNHGRNRPKPPPVRGTH